MPIVLQAHHAQPPSYLRGKHQPRFRSTAQMALRSQEQCHPLLVVLSGLLLGILHRAHSGHRRPRDHLNQSTLTVCLFRRTTIGSGMCQMMRMKPKQKTHLGGIQLASRFVCLVLSNPNTDRTRLHPLHACETMKPVLHLVGIITPKRHPRIWGFRRRSAFHK